MEQTDLFAGNEEMAEESLFISFTSTVRDGQGFASTMASIRKASTLSAVTFAGITVKISTDAVRKLSLLCAENFESGTSYRTTIEGMIKNATEDRHN